MSFGFSIGDFIVILEQAKRLRRNFSTAPAQYLAIATEVKNFSILIEDVNTYLLDHNHSEAQRKELSDFVSKCRQTLSEIEYLLSKYSSLESTRTPGIQGFTKRLWQRLKFEPNDIRDVRVRIIANISLLNAYADGYDRKTLADLVSKHNDVAEKQGTILRRQREQEDQEVLNWLAPADYIAQHSNHANQRLPDTGQWLLNSPEYIWWSSRESESSTLYLHGIPGAGKTVLSSIIIDDLLARYTLADDVGICYFYCDYSRQQDQKLEQILLRLVRQLANPAGMTVVKTLHSECVSLGIRPTLSIIKDALYATIERLSSTIIVLDALDECQSMDGCQKNLLKELSELNKLIASKVKIVITSRHPYDATMSFRNIKSMEVLASSQDIGRYVITHIQQLPNFVVQQPDLQDEIKMAIIDAVGGIFLLATLHLRALQGKRSPRQLRLTLDSMGSLRYPEAYTSTMDRIHSQVEDQKALAIDTLTWIVYAQRPLTMVELLHALAVEIDSSEFFEDDIPDINDVLSACCGLVVVEAETQLVRLVHRTTQEFLEEYGSTWLPQPQTKLSKICNTYLGFQALESAKNHTEESFAALLAKYPLYDYASWHWSDHAELRDDLNMEEIVVSQKQIDKSSRTLMDYTVPEYFSLRRRYPDVMGLHLLARCGRADMMPKFLEKYDVNEPDELMRTPISCAVQENQIEAARVLIKNGAHLDYRYEILDGILRLSADQSGSVGSALILHLVSLGNYAMVPLFLEAGAEFDLRSSNFGRGLLFKALKRKDIDGVQLLIENGAEIDHPNPGGWTPLNLACRYGNVKMIELLLDHGADPAIHIEGKDTPVRTAYTHGHLEITEMLLRKGCKLTIGDTFIETNLHSPSNKGCIEIVKCLLESNINVNAMDHNGRLALINASMHGHIEIVQLLLERGAEVDKADSGGWTALANATEYNHLEIVQLLLNKGANIDQMTVDGWWGWTPLGLAACNDSVEIVRLLLDRGALVTEAGTRAGDWIPLFHAALANSTEVVKLLCQYQDSSTVKRRSLLHKDREGRTALALVVNRGNVVALSSMLESYDILTEEDRLGCNIFGPHFMIENNDILKEEDKFGRNLLDYASMSGSTEMIQRVLELYQARNLNVESSSAWSPLHWACRNGNSEVVSVLVSAGIKVKEVETKIPAARWLPFDLAVYFENEHLVAADGSGLENHSSWLDSLRLPRVVNDLMGSVNLLRSNDLICPGASLFGRRCDGCFLDNVYGPYFRCEQLEEWFICLLCRLDVHKVHPDYEWTHVQPYYNSSSSGETSESGIDDDDSDDSG